MSEKPDVGVMDREITNDILQEQIKTWTDEARPQKLPRPTYWPFFLAFGFTFLLWGIVTTWIISVVGFLTVVVSIRGWIKDLIDETREGN